jgi:hypothetical protein
LSRNTQSDHERQPKNLRSTPAKTRHEHKSHDGDSNECEGEESIAKLDEAVDSHLGG